MFLYFLKPVLGCEPTPLLRYGKSVGDALNLEPSLNDDAIVSLGHTPEYM